MDYVPSSLEKKSVVLAYILIGIPLLLAKKTLTAYQYEHVQRATGRWGMFMVVIIIALILIWIPILKLVPILLFVGLGLSWILQVFKAWTQTMVGEKAEQGITRLFLALGKRVITVLELQIEIEGLDELISDKS